MILTCHRRIFFALGKCIARHPLIFITICLTVSSVISIGNLFAYFTDNFRGGYTIVDVQSSKELNVMLDFYHIAHDPYKIVLIGESRDGGSMLRPREFIAMRLEVERGLSLPVRAQNRSDSQSVSLRRTLRDYVTMSAERSFAVIEKYFTSPDGKVSIGFPYSMFDEQKVWTAPIMYGVQNGSVSTLLYYIFFVTSDEGALQKIKEAELRWSRSLQRRNARNDSIVELRLFGDEIVDNEIRLGAIGSIPYFLAGAALMTFIVFASVKHYDKGVIPAVVLTFWTILCPLLAATMSFACFSIVGVPINCVMFITPFLVLGVGVDDAFLMMHKWFNSKESKRMRRLCSVLVAIGPSISLSSFTNVFAFLIGSLLSPSAVRIFCLSTALALTFDWVLQLLMFTAVLVNFFSISARTSDGNSTQRNEAVFTVYTGWFQGRVIRYVLISILFLYWIASGFFAIRMREDFSPEKAFDTNSYLVKSLIKNEKMHFDHEMVRIFFTDLPTTTHELRARMKFIDEIGYVCVNYTTWIDEYDATYGKKNGTQSLQDHFVNIGAFLVDHPDFISVIQFGFNSNGTLGVSKLAFDLCVHGYGSWRERALMLRDLRYRLPNGLTAYTFDSTVFDLILSSREAVIKSILVTMLCMVFLCALFIPTFRATSAAIISVVSITTGVIGCLHLWGADLDTVVMVNIVMVIGLTVDFSAHISYRCFMNRSNIRESNKVAEAIQAVAFPTAQAAVTTMACVLPLYFYRVYMYRTFAKTIMLSSLIGFIHTILVIPLLLSFMDSCSEVCCSHSKEKHSNDKQ
ncbi:Patched domain-containing protein 3 [Toxocara canis]|uniref:Patched domain-containing protein 3 n=1 Tax=Toxocara canis TaxID=6265 RepID=A0A0B2VBS1_TOXCA|nr:Patched domain-containing protein 3 [Toxocara canis]